MARGAAGRLGAEAARSVVPVAAAFALGTGLLWLAALVEGRRFLDPGLWVRWDSTHYLEMARRGFTLSPCTRQYGPGAWCGTSGWMPLYPLAMAALARTGLSPPAAGALLSGFFHLCSLALVWALL